MSKKKFLFQKKEFDGWKTLNDTVMGGSSSAFCEISNSGLLLKGNIVEKAGGFVSCRSPIYKPSLNSLLSNPSSPNLECSSCNLLILEGLNLNGNRTLLALTEGFSSLKGI